jgi:hypothetical protein
MDRMGGGRDIRDIKDGRTGGVKSETNWVGRGG